jgi:methionyl-tRNA formyltransferase
MRIVLIGQAAFGEKVLEALANGGENIVGVYTIPDIPGRSNPLKDLAVKLGIPVFQPPRMRAAEVFEEYKKLQSELNIMAFVTDIVPESILNYPKHGTIQYHPSLLPRHRGGSSINWAIIQGDKKTGLTIFWPDKGLDTGPILLQKEIEIAPEDTVGSIYFNKLFPLGITAIMESVAMVEQGTAPRIKQDEPQATYEGLCTDKCGIINWKEPAQTVCNLIRGTNPSPGASTTYKNTTFKIFDSALLMFSGQIDVPGRIIGISEQGISVALKGGTLLIKRVQPKGSPKMDVLTFAGQVGMQVGDVLGI